MTDEQFSVKEAGPELQAAVPPTLVNVTIPQGQSVSDSANISGSRMLRLRMPTDWDSSGGAADIITFQISTDNITWRDLFDKNGAELSARIIPNTAVMVERTVGGATNTYLKIRSGTRSNPIPQAQARTFTFVLEAA